MTWPVMGDRLPADHGYRLYSALCESNGDLKDTDWQLNTVTGIPDGKGWIKLGRESKLTIRSAIFNFDKFELLDDQMIRIGQSIIQLGGLEAKSLDKIRHHLSCRICVIKTNNHSFESDFGFGVAVGRQLMKASLPITPKLGSKLAIKVRNSSIIGYSLKFFDLSPWQSLYLQRYGLGGKQKMGCGVFV